MIELITTRTLIRSVVKRWEAQYRPEDVYVKLYGADKQTILAKLKELDPEQASPEEVEAIIGNTSWTRVTCDACGSEVGEVVRLGQEPDYESATASICHECLAKAIKLIEGVTMVAK
jgi:hypothetical protein